MLWSLRSCPLATPRPSRMSHACSSFLRRSSVWCFVPLSVQLVFTQTRSYVHPSEEDALEWVLHFAQQDATVVWVDSQS